MKSTPFGEQCPFLGVMANSKLIFEDSGLLKCRSFILSQQILLTFYLFQQRVNQTIKSNKDSKSLLAENEDQSPEKAVITQLGYNSIAFIFRYTYETLVKFIEDIISLKVIIKLVYKKF